MVTNDWEIKGAISMACNFARLILVSSVVHFSAGATIYDVVSVKSYKG